MLAKSTLRQIKKEVASYDTSLSTAFAALSDRGRNRIFQLLSQHKNLCVTEIATIFDISVPAASQQLKVMEMSGLIEKKRAGQMICYHVAKDSPLVKLIHKTIAAQSNLSH